jgi:hypothetical protein
VQKTIGADTINIDGERYLNNIAILRDADTLQFKRMAPIFDSGKSMFIRQDIPDNNKALLSLRTESFAATELQLMNYVQNRKLVDISKLLGRDVIFCIIVILKCQTGEYPIFVMRVSEK